MLSGFLKIFRIPDLWNSVYTYPVLPATIPSSHLYLSIIPLVFFGQKAVQGTILSYEVIGSNHI
jgi:hypothetical protein